ncbi:MAG: protein disulfide isomerase family protein [Patescibacteria group bacterium]|nr:protein disulfide isomerase family protein [Patescibacteria group bacterium]
MEEQTTKKVQITGWLGVAIMILLIIWLVVYGVSKTDETSKVPGLLDINTTALAEHLAEDGWVMYGGGWCGHCGAQRDDFGVAKPLVPYINCWDESANKQIDTCSEIGITSYPTWISPSGERIPGHQSLETLIEISGFKQTSIEEVG